MAKLGFKISLKLCVQVNYIVLTDFSVGKWVVKWFLVLRYIILFWTLQRSKWLRHHHFPLSGGWGDLESGLGGHGCVYTWLPSEQEDNDHLPLNVATGFKSSKLHPTPNLFFSQAPLSPFIRGTYLAAPRRWLARSDPWGDSGIQRPRRRSAPSAPAGSEVGDIPRWYVGRSRTKPENTFSFECVYSKSFFFFPSF